MQMLNAKCRCAFQLSQFADGRLHGSYPVPAFEKVVEANFPGTRTINAAGSGGRRNTGLKFIRRSEES
jgi:hypothetical protein